MPTRPIIPPEQVGQRRKYGGEKQKYFLDDRGRRLIQDFYDGSTKRIDFLERNMPGIPRHVIHRWAKQLGKVTPRDQKTWTQEQDEYLRQHIHTTSMRQLEKYFKKERSSIVRRAHYLKLYREDEYEGYSMEDLVFGFGLAGNGKIQQWIKKGWLKGEKKVIAFKVEKWYFTEKDVHKFIKLHPDQLDPNRFDWLWIHDICFGGVGRLDDNKYAERKK